MNSFYITVLSDSSMGMFSNNTQSDFRTKLPKHIQVNKDDYEMALVELIIPSQIVNVTEEESQFQIVTTNAKLGKEFSKLISNKCKKINDKYTYHCCIKSGVYTSPEHLTFELDNAIQEELGEVFHKNSMVFHIGYSKPIRRIKFNSNTSHAGIHFHPTLLVKLGDIVNILEMCIREIHILFLMGWI
jgi:hypothetical protein